jgi:predicted hydrolase (HD superfamily)
MLLNRQTFGNPANQGRLLSREEAESLLLSWVPNPRLQLHMRQVGYLLCAWAKEKLDADTQTQWKWEMAGLLHDADWDQWPDLHCSKIIEEL